MDKNTLGHYGWIVIVVIIIAILLGCSAGFAGSIKTNFIGMVNRLSNEAQEGMGVIDGSGGGGGGEQGDPVFALTISNLPNSSSSDPRKVISGTFTLAGSVYSDAGVKSLTVNGTPVTVAADGAWSIPLSLTENNVTEVIVVATDNNDKTITQTRYIVYEDLLNEYGFYFNVPYIGECDGETVAVVFWDNGRMETFLDENSWYGADDRDPDTFIEGGYQDVEYGPLSATDRWNTYTFGADGKTVDYYGNTLTLEDRPVHGVYTDATYVCTEKGYEGDTVIFSEDGSVTRNGADTYELEWYTDHSAYGDGAGDAKFSLDGTVVYIGGWKYELATGPILRVDAPASASADVPTSTSGLSYTVSGTASAPAGLKSLTVNGKTVSVAADGTWSTPITLTENTTTKVVVVATDNNGKSTTVTRCVRNMVVDEPVNEYGFYYNRFYAYGYEWEGKNWTYGYVFYENGYIGCFEFEGDNFNNLYVDSWECGDFSLGHITDEFDDEYTFSADGLTMNDGYSNYFLTDDIVRGVYTGATYRCVEEGYEDQTAIFGEDNVIAGNDDSVWYYDLEWRGNHSAWDDTNVQVSLDGTVVYIDWMRYELDNMPTLTVTNPSSTNEAYPTITDNATYTVSGTVFALEGVKSLTINGVSATVAADGSWSIPLTLAQMATTEIVVLLTDNNDVSVTEIRYVYCKVLSLNVLNPASVDPASPTHTTNAQYTVSGTVSASNGLKSLTVNETEVAVDADGNWSTILALGAVTTTEVVVVATDNNNNTLTETRYVFCDYVDSIITKTNRAAYGYTSTTTDLVIPEPFLYGEATYRRVVKIDAYAFKDCTNLISVAIPSTMKSILNGAFYGCTSLSAVHISDLSAWCLIQFGDDVAQENGIGEANPLYYAKNLYLNGELVTNLVIPNDITEIKAFAFVNAACLTSLTIPDSVTTIGNRAFEGCSGLTNVTLGNSVMSIGKFAFSNCSSLTSITIPNSVTTISQGAFYNCSGLTDVYYAGTEEEWTALTANIGSYNEQIINATIHYNYTGE